MDIREIRRRFDAAARDYERHDALEREVGERLLQRLEYARRPVQRALDLGCGTGRAGAALKTRFADAAVISLDISQGMLAGLKVRSHREERWFAVMGELDRLPFAARCADLIFCNLALQWADDFARALGEFRRVLRPDGMLLFTVPGPDSLRELRGQLGRGASAEIPIYMPDLRDVGDLLVSTGFSEPVMDSEMIKLSYPDAAAMAQELAVTGGAGFARLPAPAGGGGGVEVNFEIVYGTAFGAPEGRPVRSGQGEVATFSVDQLRRR
jgi:malonyl-CoA O-methyltransferase